MPATLMRKHCWRGLLEAVTRHQRGACAREGRRTGGGAEEVICGPRPITVFRRQIPGVRTADWARLLLGSERGLASVVVTVLVAACVEVSSSGRSSVLRVFGPSTLPDPLNKWWGGK